VAKISGRRGRVYVGLASDSAVAEPVANLNQWSLNGSSEQLDATSFGDTTKTYVLGLPDAQGSFAGFYDTASDQLYTASQDGLARKTYLYPTTDITGTYWFGTAFWDFSIDTPVGGIVSISGSFVAASSFQKVQA
jgi:hypothetical protein